MTNVDSSESSTSITIKFPEGVDAEDLLFALNCGIRRAVRSSGSNFDLAERLMKARHLIHDLARKAPVLEEPDQSRLESNG